MAAAAAMWAGVVDGWSVWRFWPMLRHSRPIREAFVSCLLLNGLLLGGSLALNSHVLHPTVEYFLGQESFLWFDLFFETAWCWPVSLVALVLNTIWYQDIFDQVRPIAINRPQVWAASRARRNVGGLWFFGKFDYMKRVVAEEIVRFFMTVSFSALAALARLALVQLFVSETVSLGLYAAALSSFNSFHAFDYVWCAHPNTSSATLYQKLDHIDRHLPYYIGFGSGMGLVLAVCSRFVAAALYALIFPCVIMLTLFARPHPSRRCPLFATLFYALLSAIHLANAFYRFLFFCSRSSCCRTGR